jgi:leader peptidase (prepilin peptidase) / N-methyltransferase
MDIFMGGMGFVYMIAGLLGLCLGSFINVVLYRIYSGRSMVKGRSMCMSCGKTLGWLELIPLASYVIQGGKCRGCRSPISLQYPIIEATAALLSIAVVYSSKMVFLDSYNMVLAMGWFWAALLAVLGLLVVAVYDHKHMIIPDEALVAIGAGGVVLAGIRSLLPASSINFELWYMPVLAAVLFSGIFYALWLLTNGRGLGFGDVKLVGVIALMLTFEQGIAAILLSFWIGAVYALILMWVSRIYSKKGIGMSTAIPFGPFLVIGALIAFFTGVTVTDITNWIGVIIGM